MSSGTLDGRPQRDGAVLFSFEGMDEMDEVHGAGIARLQDGRLVFTLMCHQGDDCTFEAGRRSEISRSASRFPCQSYFSAVDNS